MIILGSGPNRIGQGIEFDYCCVHASFALRAAGFETVMVNCNPETVSTDYDTSDRLYFEPLTPEDLANVLEAEQAASRGRGPAGRGHRVAWAARPRSSWPPASPRSWCSAPRRPPSTWPRTASGGTTCAAGSASPSPPGGTATTPAEAVAVAATIGYPVLVRPSYVLGGRAMEIVYDDERLVAAVEAMSGVGGSLGREGGVTADRPVLVDRFLEDAVEVDVDAVRDATGEVVDLRGHGARRGGRACTRATRPAPCRPRRCRPRWSADLERHVRVIAEALAGARA